MLKISYQQVIVFTGILWILARTFINIKNKKSGKETSLKNELKLLLVLACIFIIERIVYFPMYHVDGHIGRLKFDISKIFPPSLNLIPFVHLNDIYAGKHINIIGNICMFIPVGIIWPACFKNINTIWKTVLSGFLLSVFIELSQLLFYERYTDIDDILMNTVGVIAGAVIYFGLKKIFNLIKTNKNNKNNKNIKNIKN